MIDLDAIRKVVERATGWGWEAAYRQDVAALVAEVERLQNYAADCKHTAATERAAVVAWLYRDGCEASAERIERGEHRHEGDE